jgi:hypothetical protein
MNIKRKARITAQAILVVDYRRAAVHVDRVAEVLDEDYPRLAYSTLVGAVNAAVKAEGRNVVDGYIQVKS